MHLYNTMRSLPLRKNGFGPTSLACAIYPTFQFPNLTSFFDESTWNLAYLLLNTFPMENSNVLGATQGAPKKCLCLKFRRRIRGEGLEEMDRTDVVHSSNESS